MLKNRGRDPRSAVPSTPMLSMRSATRAPMARPEPDYEVVEFPTEQYVNAKLQPPPPPPPRPPTGHPLDAGSSCGLCGGGNARVRCTECGRRALCASCDDMYHRHPKRRNHQRQALSQIQLRDERPPLPPKATPPVPPPRRHKMSGDRSTASPVPPSQAPDNRRATLSLSTGAHRPSSTITNTNHFATQRQFHNQHQTVPTIGKHIGSMPYLPGSMHQTNTPIMTQDQTHTMGHFVASGQPRGSLHGFNVPPNIIQPPQISPWDAQENITNNWGRPLRRGTSVMELGGVLPAPTGCSGCSHCASNPWRYGSCANLEHSWGQSAWPQTCCGPHPHNPQLLHHHGQPLQTPQPYRRAESRIMSRPASRAGSRAVSPVCSIRSRTSRRSKHRSPSPIALPSSDADSESENESDHQEAQDKDKDDENSLGPAPPPATTTWQCEHCTFVNEPGVRVCTICCRTPTTKPKIIPTEVINNGLSKLKIDKSSPSLSKDLVAEPCTKKENRGNKTRYSTERTSTGCGPSPPRDNKAASKSIKSNRLTTPTRENVNERIEQSNSIKQVRHDIAVGPSPPKEIKKQQAMSPPPNRSLVNSPIDTRPFLRRETPSTENKKSHSVSVGPSPPREYLNSKSTPQKKSDGNSPPRDNFDTRPVSRASRTTTGTSPPPQNISTQTYEVPTNWDREQSITRSRPRRRFRDDNRRERSHSRLSLSSDTRESERSVRTSGGRWEWREPRDSSPSGGGDWSESERRHDKTRLTRRASHLDLRRGKPSRRSSAYGSEIPSPESMSNNRAISLEALAGSRREAEKGLELARLMSEAERLGFSAAEVHAALAQNPAAPLAWLRERWPSLCAGVRAAAARLAPGVNVTELEARASLAKHRGAMWPAVNDCVERFRRQADSSGVGEERRLRGHVWGPSMGVDDDAAPQHNTASRIHRLRAEDSSDEFEATINKFQDDDWMYLPLQTNHETSYDYESPKAKEHINVTNDIAEKLKTLLKQAGIPLIDETLLLNGLLADNTKKTVESHKNLLEQLTPNQTDFIPIENSIVTPVPKKPHSTDFIQSENDFIDAYNALTRLSPLPNVTDNIKVIKSKEDVKVDELQTSKENTYTNNPLNSSVNRGSKESIENNTLNEKVDTEYSHDYIKNNNNSNNYGLSSENRNNRQDFSQNNDNKQTLSEIDGKQNNLSDIVDNTQKLIQQMKKEINLDINLVQDKSDNESESNNSSDEFTNEELTSDKESSYSGTETDSEELSSDEKEIFNNKRESLSDHSKQRISDNRTSSEDNENFEEAMDHVESEMENFKQTNIEMLNSIARSLHEEHTLSIEMNNAHESNSRNQDVNNNLFLAVDTFEEIYAQLDNTKHIQTENQKRIEKPYSPPDVLTKKQICNTYTKHKMQSLNFLPTIPIKLEIIENKHESLQGLIEDVPETLENINDINENENDINEITDTTTLKETLENENVNVDHSTDNEGPTELIKRDAEESSSSPPRAEYETFHNISLSRNNNENNIPSFRDDNPSNKESISYLNNKSPDVTISKENENLKPSNVTNKSNIPKLIKAIQTTKSKSDRNYPKVIVSKLPVRRGSLKHYPAPNPPKTHFGNVLSGHVKQLQTRLFNNKTPKTNPPKALVSEEPSTSTTIVKKKPAPPPPNQDKQNLPQNNLISDKKKNTYFRETCRTEDEWTESDVDEPIKIITPTAESDVNQKSISQTQPITMRHVSGQLIDLTQVRLPEGSPERQARMLLAEGATETWEQAQLAVKLVLQGTETPSALLAALECTDLPSALAYLNQECELCASKYPEHEMVSMLRCTHRCCRECARYYFTVQITERSIADCVCPFCKEPELENLPEDAWLDYFAHMDILLKTLLEPDTHELFQRKLRDRTLARDPNFKWCIECSSGFFVHPKQKRLRCPECKSITCANCRKPWNANHEDITCEQYATWLEDNDPERSIAAVQQHLRENGLECPRCRFKYSLSRGGCMHFTCTQCKYEFCYGCGKPFTMGARCGLSEYCAKLGLHAHHPRNCLFYLRDKEPRELQTLLQMNNVTYEIEASEGNSSRCPIQLQRETPGGLVDAICGSEVQGKNAGLCKMHYVEYLAGLARALDPIPIMDVSELVAELRRRALPLPERGPWDTDPIYAGMCAEIVREKIPLD